METFDILNKWCEYTKFDPEQKKFNLLSSEYELNRANKRILVLTENYDPTGAISVLYAKSICRKYLKTSKVSLFEVATNLQRYQESLDMWAIFTGPEVLAIENAYLATIDKLVQQITGKPMLGEAAQESAQELMSQSIEAVTEELDKCNIDLFLRGGPIRPIKLFSTHIQVFERLAECLLALESAPDDSVYLCYINNSGTADGYFSFFLKSNGTILSVNERVDEAYPGQHKRCRSGRWSDGKQYKLFPYDFIFEYAERDYQGYASKHIIDNEQLDFCKLEADVYLPLVLAMVMLHAKFVGRDMTDLPPKLSDSLLPINIAMPVPGETALVVPKNSEIAVVHQKFELSLTTDDVLSGSPATEFNYSENKVKHHLETGCFLTKTSLFVELYGEGFALNKAGLLEANTHLKSLPSPALAKTDEQVNVELVGTHARMEMIAYMNARKQLADHIRAKMFDEYQNFGGGDAVQLWWQSALSNNRDQVYALCAEKYQEVSLGEERNVCDRNWRDASGKKLSFIGYKEDCRGEANIYVGHNAYVFNSPHAWRGTYPDGKWLCPITGKLASIFFVFRPNDWKDLTIIIGEKEIPKIVKGWTSEGHRTIGNPILSATDAVSGIGTPFEDGERRINPEYKENANIGFRFAVGFSKNGFKKIIKEHQEGRSHAKNV